MIFQDPLSHLNPVHTIGWQLAEVFSAHGVATGAEARERAIDILRRVGIPERRTVSISIAPVLRRPAAAHHDRDGDRAEAGNPDCDEPTTALDVSVQAQILDLLKKLQAEDGLAIIMITHDLEVAASMADRVIVMKSGRIVEEGEARSVFENPAHSYTQTLINALPHADHDRPARPERLAGKPILQVRNIDKFYTLSSGLFTAPFNSRR